MIAAGSATYAGVSQYRAGKEAKEEAKESAALTKKKWEIEEEQERRRIRQLLARQKTLYAKAGVDISSGSPLEMLAETEEQAAQELEAMRLGKRLATGALLSRGDVASQMGQQALIGGMASGASSLLGGLSKAGGMMSTGTPQMQLPGHHRSPL